MSEIKESDDEQSVKEIKTDILSERIDRIDKLNNIRKQYLSDFYIVVYGKNEIDLENVAINIASEIAKCGLSTQLLGKKDTAVFLKYSFSRNFDEREVRDIPDEELIGWIKPTEVEFHANGYTIDGMQASVLAIADYPLRVKNAWGAELFNIPNTKVVMRMKPVDKFKAIKRIDKCISEMETKQIISEKASETNSAEIHQESMVTLLDSLQAENESMFDVTLTVTAYNYLSDDNYKKVVRRQLTSGNFKANDEFKKIRVAAYCRVSTDSEDQLQSYKAQVAYYTEAIAKNPKWKMVDVYADEGLTGTRTEKRVNFNRMMRDCERGRIDYILTKSVARFARNTVDSLKWVRKLKAKGIGVFFEEQNLDSLKTDNELLLGMHSVMAQAESENISANVRWGIQQRMKSGTYKFRYNLLGYVKGEDGQPVIIEEEAVHVRKVFDMYLEGCSIRQCREYLIGNHGKSKYCHELSA